MQSNSINAGAGAGFPTARTLNRPFSVENDGTRLIVPDQLNHRVLIWNSFPTQNQQAADVVLGQPDMISAVINNTPGSPGTVSARGVNFPLTAYSNGERLFILDELNHRVLIWNSFPTQNQQPADLVLGQPNLDSNSANNTPGSPGTVSAQGLNTPLGLTSDGQRLFIVDSGNSRVLIWNNLPTTNQAPADIVLGQSSMSGSGGGTTSQKFSNPYFIAVCGQKLLVGDRNNNRVLIWNSIPTQMQQPADIVLGQPDMVTSTANNTPGSPGTVSAQSLSFSASVNYDCVRVFVGDLANHRVLIWNSFPTQNQQAADVVLGQPDFLSNTPNNGGVSSRSFQNPTGSSSNAGMRGIWKPGGY
jgi:hypothetical protein